MFTCSGCCPRCVLVFGWPDGPGKRIPIFTLADWRFSAAFSACYNFVAGGFRYVKRSFDYFLAAVT